MTRPPKLTIKSIAEAVGISMAAASKALNDRPGISESNRLKVKKVAEAFGYRPYLHARRTGMHLPGGRHLAVLLGPVGFDIAHAVQMGIAKVLAGSALSEIRCDLMPGDPRVRVVQDVFLRKILEDSSVAGLVAAFVAVEKPILEKFDRHELPIVFIDGDRVNKAHGNVYLDHESGGRDAARTLIKLKRRSIAYIGPSPEAGWVWAARHRGIMSEVAKARIPFHFEPEPECDATAAAFATRRIMEQHENIDAIIYARDAQAVGGLKILREMEIDVPKRVAVIGFDDTSACRIVHPTLSSVKQPFEAMGATATRMLLKAISGKKRVLSHRVFPTKIVLRESCLPGYRGDRWYFKPDS